MRVGHMRLVRGDNLLPETRQAVLRAWAHRRMDKTCKDDKEWLRKHAFYIRKDGHLDLRYKHCEPDFMANDPCPNCGRNKYEPTKAGCCDVCRMEKEMNNA